LVYGFNDVNKFLLPGISTARLRFRLLEAEDFSLCLPFFQDPRSHQYWDTQGKDPQTLCTEWFEKQEWRYMNDKGGAMALIEKDSGTLVGWCGLLVQEVDGLEELEVGYSLLPAHWNKGYATEAARRCLEVAFGSGLAESVISIIQIHNVPSQRVAEKNGLHRDKQTLHHGNPVFIYRIHKRDMRMSES
jgi:RimJ/RimL family protein N-acetyltransferase